MVLQRQLGCTPIPEAGTLGKRGYNLVFIFSITHPRLAGRLRRMIDWQRRCWVC